MLWLSIYIYILYVLQHGNLTLLATTQISCGIYSMASKKMYQEASYGVLDGDEVSLIQISLKVGVAIVVVLSLSFSLLDGKVDIPFIN